MILVTGGTGFLGHHLVANLCRAGQPVRLLTRSPKANPWLKRYPNVDVVGGDLLDATSVARAVQGCDEVIHAAGLFSFWGDDAQFEATNVTGTENLMKAALEAAVERLVFVSTVVVIGNPESGREVDESHPVRPLDAYQRSKYAAEQVVLRYQREQAIEAVIVRPGAFYGPMGNYAFNRLFFKDAMRGLIVVLDGGHYVTFPIYIQDVVQGIRRALARGRSGEIYNLCGECLTHNEVFDIICEEANLRWPRIPMPGGLVILFARFLTAIGKVIHREPFYPINLRPVIFNNWRVSSDKAQRELGFKSLPFREGAKRTVAWYRAGCPDDWWELDCDQNL